MSDMNVKICRAENGYKVEARDPGIEADNEANKRYRDPWVAYVFQNKEDLNKFLDDNLDTFLTPMKSKDEYTSAFAKAVKL